MSNNPLSNISYTNKDFNSIYVELLDLVKKLTYKWDPTISNESDPGNILIKLNAIIGDKNNYNIDKNVLENFPETLTQDISARSLYRQLAYKMSWYHAATNEIFFKWCGNDKYKLTDTSGNINIDKFQLICDANSEFIYTTLEPISLSKSRPTQSVKAIEGIINTLNFNGQDYIEISNLDHNNRIYFDEHNIAENGLFIYNYGGNDNYYWNMVDNLQVQPLGNRVFEFGVDPRKNLCYIEFPEDIDKLIGEGLVIKYIVTNGVEGNVIAQVLDRFYEDVTVNFNGEDVLLNSDLIQIRNMTATNNGTNPEDTESAYKNYRRIAGTFHTLVTLRDYVNAIYSSGLVSNVQVCDRLNDVQSTYSIVTTSQTIGKSVKKVAKTGVGDYIGYARLSTAYEIAPTFITNTFYLYNNNQLTLLNSEPNNWSDNFGQYYYKVDDIKEDMGAFDLKLYALHTPGNVTNFNDYKSTFDIEPSNGIVEKNIKGYIEDEKCIQHDFKPILPNIPCMFRNVFPVDIKIIPHYKLDDNQITELKININKALFQKLNSSNLDFGVEANYDIIYDTILNADERIKVLILDDFNYTTFATYWDGKEFKNIPVSDFNDKNIIVIDDSIFDDSYSTVNNILLQSENNVNVYLDDETSPYIVSLRNVIRSYKSILNYYQYNNTYFITTSNNYVYMLDDNKLKLYSSKINSFRKDVITKSILAGITPLYKDDNIFQFLIDQDKKCLEDVERISTNLTICPFGVNEGTENPITLDKENLLNNSIATYELSDNENIRFLAPSLKTETTYSNYTKFELILDGSNGIEQSLALRYNDYMLDSKKYNRKQVILERTTDYGNTYTQETTDINLYDYAKRVAMNNELATDHNERKVSLYDTTLSTTQPVYVGLLSHLLNYTESYTYIDASDNTTHTGLRLKVILNGNTKKKVTNGVITFTDDSGKDLDGEYKEQENYIYIDGDTDTSYVWDGNQYRKSLYVFEHKGNNVASKDTITRNEHILTAKNYNASTNEYCVTGKLHNIFDEWYINNKYVANTYTTVMDFDDIIMQEWQNKECNVIHTDKIYSVPAKSDYMLKSNEYITFFWKEEDSDDAPYMYKRYGAGTIIKPSFNVQGVTSDSALIKLDNLSVSDKIYYSELTNSMYQKIYAMYDYNELSGTKTIDIRVKNKITIDKNDNRNYYFITNNIERGNTMKEDSVDKYIMELTNDGYYTLNNDEYFIITDSDFTSFELFGAGTLLMFTQEISGAYVPLTSIEPVVAVNYEDIAKNGLSVFADKCQPLSFKCIVQQQQMYNFSKGDRLIFRVSETQRNYINSNITNSVVTPKFESNKYTPIGDFDISYVPASTGLTDTLPKIQVSDDDSGYGWTVTSLLNISTSYDVPQCIPTKTSNTPYSKATITVADITYPSEADMDNGPLYLLSSVMLDKVGGNNIDITYVDSYGRRVAPYIYVYTKNDSLSDLTLNTDNTYSINLAEFNDNKIDIVKPHIIDIHNDNANDGKLLLPIHNVGMNITFEVLFNNIPQIPVNSKSVGGNTNPINGRGTFYYQTDSADFDNLGNDSITIKWYTPNGVNVSDTDQILIDPLFKYQPNTTFQDKYNISFEDIQDRLNHFDTDGEFNYVYSVPSNELIEDPLESKKFFDNNHIFNKFTLPMADLYMSNNTQSTISLINNR